jgi:uroporphyrin-3 C-methyltransferase
MLADNEQNQQNTPKPSPRNKHGASIGLGLLTLLILGSLGYTLYTQQQLHVETQNKTHDLVTKLHALEQRQVELHNLLETEQTTHQIAEANVRATLDKLNNQFQSAITPSHDVSNHWLLLKAHYTLELAQLNAYWSTDRNTTITLLKQADSLLAQQQSPQLFPVRQALAREITEQETAPMLDQAGILSQLDAVQQQIVTRPFQQTSPLKQEITLTHTTKLPDSWQGRIHACLGLLKQFFVVRYHPDPLQPLLTPAYKALQRETIRLNLQEAQWAILQRNEAVYQLVLKQTMFNVNRAFGKNNTSTQSLIQVLTDLKNIPIHETKIIPETSLAILNQIMDTPSIEHDEKQITPTSSQSSSQSGVTEP